MIKLIGIFISAALTANAYGGILCQDDYLDSGLKRSIARSKAPALFAVYDRHQSTSAPETAVDEQNSSEENSPTFNFEGVGTCWFLSGKVYTDIHSEVEYYKKNKATQQARLTTMKSYIFWDNAAKSFRVILGDSYDRTGGGVIVLVHSPYSINRNVCEREHRFILNRGQEGWGVKLPKKMPGEGNHIPHEFHYDQATESATALLWPGNNEELNYSHGVCYFVKPHKVPFL